MTSTGKPRRRHRDATTPQRKITFPLQHRSEGFGEFGPRFARRGSQGPTVVLQARARALEGCSGWHTQTLSSVRVVREEGSERTMEPKLSNSLLTANRRKLPSTYGSGGGKLPQVAASCRGEQAAASCGKLPQVAVKLPLNTSRQVAASCRQVAVKMATASRGNLPQLAVKSKFQLDGISRQVAATSISA